MNATDYFAVAVGIARKTADAIIGRAERQAGIGATSVRVRGEIDESFARCDAEIEPDGVLTIRSVDDHAVLREFQPAQWFEVHVRDAEGTLLWSCLAGVR